MALSRIAKARKPEPDRNRSFSRNPQEGESLRWLDYPQSAAYLNCSERFVRSLWERRQIPAYKMGRRVRFAEEDLRAWAERQRVEAVS